MELLVMIIMGITSNDNYGELLVMIIMGITSNDNYGNY